MSPFSSDAIVSEIGKSLKDNAVDVEIKAIEVLICYNTVKMNKKNKSQERNTDQVNKYLIRISTVIDNTC